MSAFMSMLVGRVINLVQQRIALLGAESEEAKDRAADLVRLKARFLEENIKGTLTEAEVDEMRRLLKASAKSLLAASSIMVVSAVDDAFTLAISDVFQAAQNA